MIKKKKLDAKSKEIRVRCWIDINGAKHFGPGPLELLERIQESGSISKAAKAMDMSYKKAWDMIEKMNARGQKPYVVSHKGGKQGGGAELTPAGQKVVELFKRLDSKIKTIVEKESDILKWI